MNNLTIFSTDVIPVYTTNKGEKVVYGRELHDKLKISKKYVDWIESMITYGFSNMVDYTGFWEKDSVPEMGKASRIVMIFEEAHFKSSQQASALGFSKNHLLKLDMAKHIAMIQRTPEGKSIRQKLIDLEKEPVKKLTNEQIMRIQLGMMDEQGERLEDVEQRVDKLETTMTVDYEQQQRLKELAKTVVINAVGGKKARAYTYQYSQRDENDKPPKMYGMVISRLWHDYQDYFEVNSYRNTPKVKYEEALKYINAWQPPTNMQLDIGKINRGEI